jgi:prevent-host-death family protein
MKPEPAEMSVRELRADLADVINAASTRDQVTFVTSRGRRVAGVVSVAAAERAAGPDGQADGDAGTAVMFAVNLAMLLDRGGTPSLTPDECFEQYAGDLVREFGGSADRALAAGRAVIEESAGKAGYPALWRQAALAVELCQRAAEITGPELPGSYRPGSQASSAARR